MSNQKEKDSMRDEGLKGNEQIEEAILALQQEATPEMLAHALTVIRRRMKEGRPVDCGRRRVQRPWPVHR